MPPKVAKKPAAKPAVKSATKPAAKDKPVKSTPKPVVKSPNVFGVAKEDRPVPKSENDVTSVALMLFTKCDGAVVLLICKEAYEKWGIPSGYVVSGETPDHAFKRVFVDEIGVDLPAIKKQDKIQVRNTLVYMLYTDVCVSTKIGPKAVKGPEMLLELMHIPVGSIYKFIENPSVDTQLKSVFITTMLDLKPRVDTFVKSM